MHQFNQIRWIITELVWFYLSVSEQCTSRRRWCFLELFRWGSRILRAALVKDSARLSPWSFQNPRHYRNPRALWVSTRTLSPHVYGRFCKCMLTHWFLYLVNQRCMLLHYMLHMIYCKASCGIGHHYSMCVRNSRGQPNTAKDRLLVLFI